MLRHCKPLAMLFMAGLLLANAPQLQAADDAGLTGKWKVVLFSGPSQFTTAQVELTAENGKLTKAELRGGSPQLKIENATSEKNKLEFTIKSPANEQRFSGLVPDATAKAIRGTMLIGERVYAAELQRTEDAAANRTNTSATIPGLTEYNDLTKKSQTLAQKVRQASDPEARSKAMAEYKQAMSETQKEQARLLVSKLDQGMPHPAAVLFAVPFVLRNASTLELKAEQVKGFAGKAEAASKDFGPVMQHEVATLLAEQLITNPAFAAQAGEYARTSSKLLPEGEDGNRAVRTLKVLARVLKNEKKDAELKAVEARLGAIETKLDKAYLASVPPFKPTTYQGRKANTSSTVVMELFTGAQCPPCVAADVAFDALQKSYKPTDLILIQYHMHIPGPDPMTTPDSEARMRYYQAANPGKVNGTPSTIFNGKVQAGGGGSMAGAESKFKEYKGIIDPQFEESAGAKLTGTAKRDADQIEIKVSVGDLEEAGPEKKLRLVLVEETVRYVGGNNLRFHHQVVRGMPGGPEGIALTEKQSNHTVKVDLKEIRQKLNKYLDAYGADHPFPSLDRPLDFKNLRVIAFVQDDKDQKILQGLQMEVGDNVAAR